jgi:hypothetical protein
MTVKYHQYRGKLVLLQTNMLSVAMIRHARKAEQESTVPLTPE